ncbi:MAG: tetratricopeptide repeat protein [Acidobacteria bacterium]|nr:tetratricopeptide repeat protein [Acidobacteriota bacterium]
MNFAKRYTVGGSPKATPPTLTMLALLAFAIGCASDPGADSALKVTAAPSSCEIAVTSYGSGDTEMDKRIRVTQERVARSEKPAHLIEHLGWLYVAKARSTSDPGFWRLAGEAADCIETKTPGSAAALLLKGHVLHNLHQFHEAEAVARQLIARREAPFDYGLLGDSLMELGRLDEAADAYQSMMDLKPSLHSYSRASHLRWLKGDLEGAIEAMEMAAGAASPRDPGAAAWVYTRLANYRLQAGEFDRGLDAATMALSLQPDFPAAFVAKGRVLLARGETKAAAETLERAVSLSPATESLWALADVLRDLGRTEEAAQRERQLERDGPSDDPRTLSLYLATRGLGDGRSVELARREMKNRADVFTHDALAWALHQNGQSDLATDVMQRALREHTEDARLFLHAGAIAAERGMKDDASGWLRLAEKSRQTLLPSEQKYLVALSASLQASPPSP